MVFFTINIKIKMTSEYTIFHHPHEKSSLRIDIYELPPI